VADQGIRFLINCAFLYERLVHRYSDSRRGEATNTTEDLPTETTALLAYEERETVDSSSEELSTMELHLRVSLIRVGRFRVFNALTPLQLKAPIA
jgi:hypothetical protein